MAIFRYSLLFVFLYTACDYNEPKPESAEIQIAGNDAFGKTYQITKIEVDLGELVPKQCITDNFITYFPNGSYEINEGATKCDPSDSPAIRGTWRLINDDFLIISLQDSTQNWTLETIGEDRHIISSDFSEGSRTYTLHSSN